MLSVLAEKSLLGLGQFFYPNASTFVSGGGHAATWAFAPERALSGLGGWTGFSRRGIKMRAWEFVKVVTS
jgi:hypothetical protein